MKLIFSALAMTIFSGIVSASASSTDGENELSATEGFGVSRPITFVPVTVCPPGVLAGYSSPSWECTGGQSAISPEQYVRLLCPGASLAAYDLTGDRIGLSVIMRFKVPKGGCPSEKSDTTDQSQ